MESATSYRHNLTADLARLRQGLQSAFVEARFEPIKPDQVRILNLACGSCDEAKTLVDLAQEVMDKRQIGKPPTQIHLTGVDVRSREIGHARANHPGKNFRFLEADASLLQQQNPVGHDYDWVFIRHQNFWNGRLLWQRIFDNALHLLSPTGLLIITSYFDREHLLALEALQALGAQLLLTRQQALSRPLPSAGKSVDRHLAVFRRQAPEEEAGFPANLKGKIIWIGP